MAIAVNVRHLERSKAKSRDLYKCIFLPKDFSTTPAQKIVLVRFGRNDMTAIAICILINQNLIFDSDWISALN